MSRLIKSPWVGSSIALLGLGMIRLIRSSRIGIIVAAAGLLIMGFGISRGEMPVVFEKAVNICMECVGIG